MIQQDSSSTSFCGLEMHFLGTGSNVPTSTRSTSALALKLGGEIWLFDAGEGVQRQIVHTHGQLSYGKISHIFITHLHGDHVFGLPGLLCCIGQNENTQWRSPQIYGPYGLKEYVNTSLKLTRSYTAAAKCIHEFYEKQFIQGVPINIYENEKFTVHMAPIKHRIACYGYVITEKTVPGNIIMEKAIALGLQPGPKCKKLKNGESIQLDNGTIIHPHQVMTPPNVGRKIVILGDTCDSSNLMELAQNADVLVHEATFANDLKAKAIVRGHSTAGMAGEFARKINAKTLILNHLSPRYKEDKNMDEEDVRLLVQQAKETYQSDSVLAARDFLIFPVEKAKYSH